MKLIDEPTVGGAYAFGWSKLGAVLSEYWWIYAIAVILDAALSTLGADGSGFRYGSLTYAIASFPAVATTARFVRSDARMRARDVFAMLGMSLLMALVLIAAVLVVILVAKLSSTVGFFAGLGTFGLFVWLVVKCVYVQIVYINARERRIGTAFAESFELAETNRWWSTLGLSLAIVATMFVPNMIVSGAGLATLYALHASGSGLPLFLVIVAADALVVVTVVWSTASLTALASSFGALQSDADIAAQVE